MNLDHPDVIRFLQLATAGKSPADVPPELALVARWCENKGLARAHGVGELVGWTPIKTTCKKARDLQPGDCIQMEPRERRALVVKCVLPLQRRRVRLDCTTCTLDKDDDAEVVVFDGPPPEPVYGAGEWVLLPDGENVLIEDAMRVDVAETKADPPDNYAEYRDGPDGQLLTPTYTKERYKVSGKDLSTDPEARRHRRKNPAGRDGGDYVYRYVDTCRIANQKDHRKDRNE